MSSHLGSEREKTTVPKYRQDIVATRIGHPESRTTTLLHCLAFEFQAEETTKVLAARTAGVFYCQFCCQVPREVGLSVDTLGRQLECMYGPALVAAGTNCQAVGHVKSCCCHIKVGVGDGTIHALQLRRI